MSRRSQITTSQRIDLMQRRRTRDLSMYSESPIPLDFRRLSGAGAGGGGEAPVVANISWLSSTVSWLDPTLSWLP